MQLGATALLLRGWHAGVDQVAAIEAAATALAVGGIPEAALGFDEDVVGPFGAGFAWQEEESGAAGSPQLAPSDCDSEAGDFTKVRLINDGIGVGRWGVWGGMVGLEKWELHLHRALAARRRVMRAHLAELCRMPQL